MAGPYAHSEKGLFPNEAYMGEDRSNHKVKKDDFLCVNLRGCEVGVFMWIGFVWLAKVSNDMFYTVRQIIIMPCNFVYNHLIIL